MSEEMKSLREQLNKAQKELQNRKISDDQINK